MQGKIKYEFISKVWQHAGYGSWHFVSLPKKLAKEIRDHIGSEEQGWGRLKASAKIGISQWDTAIWFDTKQGTYLLPLKAGIRKKEMIKPGTDISVIVFV